MSNAEKSFYDWYFNNGADWNTAHVKPVFIAGWKAAIKAAAEQAEKEVTMEGYEKEIARDIRAL